MNKKHINILLIFSFLSLTTYSQKVSSQKVYVLPAIVVGDDTLAIVKLDRVNVFPPLKFKDHAEYLNYRRLVRDVKKVYPYAQIARKALVEIQLTLNETTNKRERKKYVKEKEKELMGLYSEELKQLTVRQGRILIKLVDRELDNTSFELIKELRGGGSAFMWQQIAKLFGENLKSEYDAKGDDLLIERIIIMIESGRL